MIQPLMTSWQMMIMINKANYCKYLPTKFSWEKDPQKKRSARKNLFEIPYPISDKLCIMHNYALKNVSALRM